MISAPFPLFFNVSFHVGVDVNLRRPMSFNGFGDAWEWLRDTKRDRLVLAMCVTEPMHIFGVSHGKGTGHRLDVEVGQWLIADPRDGTIEIVTVTDSAFDGYEEA
jgi:hypothetical protein